MQPDSVGFNDVPPSNVNVSKFGIDFAGSGCWEFQGPSLTGAVGTMDFESDGVSF
jgi:hypothetical protein